MKVKKSNLKLKEVVTVAIVVSFITSSLVGFMAGYLGYDLISRIKSEQITETEKEVISSGEESVINVVEQVSPAVVSIIVSKDLPILEKYYQEYSPFGDDPFLRQFFGNDFFFQIPQYRQKGTEKQEIGGGTGFIVSSDGLILTNKHVVSEENAEYTVLTNEGERIEAEVLAIDPVQDIAVLKIDKKGLPTVELGNSDNIKIGQTVVAIGNALGEFRNTVSVGIVSGLRRSIVAQSFFGESEYLAEVIQTDAAINQGNSGGPLLDSNGRVIGINVAMAQDAENIGFALPINKAKRDIEQVRKEGKISYPFLGVRYTAITPELKEKENLSVDYGALIIRGEKVTDLAITPGSPADKAGLKENDIILELNNEKITQDNNLSEIIEKYQVGDTVELKIFHQKEEKIIKLQLEERS